MTLTERAKARITTEARPGYVPLTRGPTGRFVLLGAGASLRLLVTVVRCCQGTALSIRIRSSDEWKLREDCETGQTVPT